MNQKEFESIKDSEIFSKEYKKKKLTKYLIRTSVAIVVYFLFWDNQWMRWSLWIYAPLNLIGVMLIFLLPPYLNKKHNKLRKNLDEL